MAPFIFFDNGPDGSPALFDAPLRIVSARTPGDVEPAFRILEQSLEAGRWVAGFFAYELGYVLEPALTPLLPAARRGPLLQFGVFDRAPTDRPPNGVFEQESDRSRFHDPQSDWSREQYARAFQLIHQGIEAGDYYQVNLTMRLRMRLKGSLIGLYGALRNSGPVNHGALVHLGAPTLLSRSPELFFEISDGRSILTSPMKGTAPRGQSPEEDAKRRRELQNDAKNRAENLMIVDLLRNDLSRISESGSVSAPKLFHIESHGTLHQMVSCVQSRLRQDVSWLSLFRSLFPCGSVTGAPKIAAMRAIRNLEAGPREAYCGAIGWIAPDGRARFNVAIRTLLHYEGDEIILNVGGGLVADSTADSEYDEALWKARFATTFLRT